MIRAGVLATLGGLVSLLAGCGNLGDLLPGSQTTVRLVNDADYEVRVTVIYDDDQLAARDVLSSTGNAQEFTIAPGETRSFSRDCDALQAVVVDKAELNVVGSIGPETDSDVIRDGSDFGCGDTITFTFDNSSLIVDFHVNVSVSTN